MQTPKRRATTQRESPDNIDKAPRGKSITLEGWSADRDGLPVQSRTDRPAEPDRPIAGRPVQFQELPGNDQQGNGTPMMDMKIAEAIVMNNMRTKLKAGQQKPTGLKFLGPKPQITHG
jgi:hypothetical protein